MFLILLLFYLKFLFQEVLSIGKYFRCCSWKYLSSFFVRWTSLLRVIIFEFNFAIRKAKCFLREAIFNLGTHRLLLSFWVKLSIDVILLLVKTFVVYSVKRRQKWKILSLEQMVVFNILNAYIRIPIKLEVREATAVHCYLIINLFAIFSTNLANFHFAFEVF